MEDSLYWIAYATQPSNIVPGAITPSPFNTAGDDGAGKSSTKTGADAETSAAGGAQTAQQAAQSSAHAENKERAQRENEELRRRVAVEAMALSQRVPRVMKQVRHEEERIARLAEVYQVRFS